jgi:two-component system cell cycle sensor histidine kinase/response regulator CckA
VTEALRVLLVEDSPTDAKLVVQVLGTIGRPVEHERVQDALSMRAALERRTWDVVLSDWSMPGFSALAALDIAKQVAPDLPFIIVSGTIGEERAADAMRAGAHDYVLKDRLARLVPAVERELRESKERAARRRAEEALRVSEAVLLSEQARFRALVENCSDGITLNTRDACFAYVSPAAARTFGCRADELIGQKILDYTHPDDRPHAMDVMRRVRETAGAIETTAHRVVRSDGTCRWVEITRTNKLDDPAVGGVVCNLRDVTDRQRTEDALVVVQQRFTALLESGILGIVVADSTGKIQEANEAFLSMLGYTRQDSAAGQIDWRQATPPEWAAWNVEAGEELARKGWVRPSEKEYLRKDGTRVPVLVGMAVVEGAQVISFSIDLTERKRVEKTLRETEDQLRHAQKMEAVGRLAGGVAHDFNNMLSVILSYADLLLGDIEESDPVHADILEIRNAGLRAADLTRQLLMFSRQQVIAPRVLDLNEVLSNMKKMLTRLLGEDIELLLAPGCTGRVLVDQSSIEQVVMNLVVNARDAMPTGGMLTIETADFVLDEERAREHPGAKAGRHVRLAVADTGTGMDAATRARIFEPFFTTKEQGKGTGLGLSTVFGIVTQSGGNIRVDSAPGQGTRFEVCLPRVDRQTQAPLASVAPATLRGSETILLVEDEDALRAVARSILERSGYQVLEARNAGEALLLCEQHAAAIHLLVSDVVMPKMSGPELAKRLAVTRPAMKVLCMSGYTDDSIVRHGVLQGDLAFLQKPITPETLTRKVREVLDANGG